METKIKKVLANNGLKQGFIAEKVGISRSALSLIVNAKSIPYITSSDEASPRS